MISQRFTFLAVAVAASLALVAPTWAAGTAASGVSTADYELTADSTIPAADGQVYPNALQAIFAVSPQGSIVAPGASASDPTGTPVTLLSTTTGASTDPSQLVAGIKNVTNPDGSTKELFGLSLFGKGLQAAADGGHVDIALTVNPALPLPTFTVDPTSAFQDVHLSLIPVPTATTTTPAIVPTVATTPTTPPASTTPTVFTPEPMSLVLWSALAGAGLLRARTFRRRRAA